MPADLPLMYDSAQIRNIARYDTQGLRHDLRLDRISDALALNDGSFIWVGLFEPDEALLFKMQVEFDLHPLAIEDAHNAHQRSKIERYGDCLFIVVHTAQIIRDTIEFGETHIFLGAQFMITVRHDASTSYAPARERCEKNPEHLKIGSSMALYTVLDFIVDNFLPIVKNYEDRLNSLESEILSSVFQRETIIHLYKLKADLTKLRLAVSPLQDILTTLIDFHAGLIRDEVRVYLRDVHDHVIRLNESVDAMRETIAFAMTTNLSLVTVSQGNTMKRLAGWAGLLAVPTLLTSWYGMNFVNMPELEWPYAYWVVLAVNIVICYTLYRGLKKAGWL